MVRVIHNLVSSYSQREIAVSLKRRAGRVRPATRPPGTFQTRSDRVQVTRTATRVLATVVIGTGAVPGGRVLSCRSPSRLLRRSAAASAKPPGGLRWSDAPLQERAADRPSAAQCGRAARA